MIYKYYPAFNSKNEPKPGINRITLDEKGVEITREYLPEVPDGKLEMASEEEIKFSLTKPEPK